MGFAKGIEKILNMELPEKKETGEKKTIKDQIIEYMKNYSENKKSIMQGKVPLGPVRLAISYICSRSGRWAQLFNKAHEQLKNIDPMDLLKEKELNRVLGEIYMRRDSVAYKNAKEKILVAMYSMIYDPDDPFDWANDLIRELVNAKERGVKVEVLLEYRTYNGYMDVNLEAYNYLKMHGVNVRLDYEKDTDHMKLIVIDGRIVYVGSHNWSEAALYYNHETSVKIVSEEIAKTYEAYFETI